MPLHLHPSGVVGPQVGDTLRFDGTDWTNVRATELCAMTVAGDVNANNLVLTLTAVRTDANWSVAANEAAYAGSPDSVDIKLNVYLDGIAGQRVTPRIRVQRKNGPGGTYGNLAIGDVYIRDASGAEEGNISISVTDHNPGVDPIYRLFTLQGATPGNVANATDDETSFSLRAWV